MAKSLNYYLEENQELIKLREAMLDEAEKEINGVFRTQYERYRKTGMKPQIAIYHALMDSGQLELAEKWGKYRNS